MPRYGGGESNDHTVATRDSDTGGGAAASSTSDVSQTALVFVLKMENRNFLGHVLSSAIGYLLITLWLNGIRTTAPIWIVWTLITVQLVLYVSIFFVAYQRSKVMGFNNTLTIIIFPLLAILGRVDNWEIIVIPVLLVVTIIFSARNKRISINSQALLSCGATGIRSSSGS